jgi:hypothetical protein
VNFWLVIKGWLVLHSGLDDVAWHLLAGVVLLLVGAALFRRVPWNWRALILPVGLELINEANDLWVQASGESTLGSSIHDLWVTLLLPVLIVLVTPWLIRRDAARAAMSPTAASPIAPAGVDPIPAIAVHGFVADMPADAASDRLEPVGKR